MGAMIRNMRSHVSLFALLLVVCSLALPLAAHAAIPFFGPIVPDAVNRCAAGWGLVMVVVNNIISFLITIAIVFVAPLMIAWSGFLYVVNPVDPSGISKAKSILLNTIVGIVIALAGWLIVNAVMAALYSGSQGASTWGIWSELVTTGGASICLPVAGSLKQVPGQVPSVSIPGVASKFTFDPGIDAQMPTASGPLAALLSCMVDKVPAGVGRISSISDSLIINGQKTFAQCTAGGCQHSANSCHYGGRSCVGSSYAVDFGDEQNMSVLTAAAQACGGTTLNERTHLHVSVGAANGCGCGI